MSALRAPMRIEFDYTRSLGPVLGRFMTGLRDGRILGTRASDGTVHAPPFEYDPLTHRPPAEFVEVGPAGTVLTWSWMPSPLDGQPLDRAFAWALIRLDGADTAMLHAVDAGDPAGIASGMRVTARWSPARTGSITDIACFEPSTHTGALSADSDRMNVTAIRSGPDGCDNEPVPSGGAEPVSIITTPIRLRYEHTAAPGEAVYLRGLAEGRLLGQRCPACGKVYIPARGTCPTDGVPMTETVQLAETGTVTTFCVVNVPYPGQQVQPPYVAAAVLLDGADIAFQQLILGCPAQDVRMGMRVRAVWRDRAEWATSAHNISHFEPSDEPDAPYDSYARHL